MWLFVPGLPSHSAQDTEGSSSGFGWFAPIFGLWVLASGKPTRLLSSQIAWSKTPWIRVLSGTIWNPSLATSTAVVDLVLAGFPCQPASVAGKRAGTDDARWLWPLVWRTVVAVEARWLFVENVPGLLSVNDGRAFGEILDALSARGWSAEWDCVSARSVGAPHERDRVFVLASDSDRVGVRLEPERDQREGRGERAAERGDREPSSVHRGEDDPDTDGERLEAKPRRRKAKRAASADGEDGDAQRGDRPSRSSGLGPDTDGDGRKGKRRSGQLDTRVRTQRGSDVNGRRGPRPRLSDVARRAIERILDEGDRHWQWRNAPEPAIPGMDEGLPAGWASAIGRTRST